MQWHGGHSFGNTIYHVFSSAEPFFVSHYTGCFAPCNAPDLPAPGFLAEALEAWKKVENSIVSFTAVGISIDSEAANEASAACATAQALIVSLFPAGQTLSNSMCQSRPSDPRTDVLFLSGISI